VPGQLLLAPVDGHEGLVEEVGEDEGLSQGGQRGRFVTAVGMGQCLEHQELDGALGPTLRRGQGRPRLQQLGCPFGCLLGEQHPRQDQVVTLVRVAWPILDGEAALPDPAAAASTWPLASSSRPAPLGRG
jgi:hypothetical protein